VGRIACIIDPWVPTASITECAPSPPVLGERLRVPFGTELVEQLR
jgi:hypothetical protein